MKESSEVLIENQWTPLEAISIMLRGLMQLLYGLMVPCLFVLFVVVYVLSIFENDDGWHDLDTMEILFLILFFVLTRYFFKQRERGGLSWWQALSRYCHFSVIYHLIAVFPILVLATSAEAWIMIEPYGTTYDMFVLYGYLCLLLAYSPSPYDIKDTEKTNSKSEETSREGTPHVA